jgi:hypothetical protein
VSITIYPVLRKLVVKRFIDTYPIQALGLPASVNLLASVSPLTPLPPVIRASFPVSFMLFLASNDSSYVNAVEQTVDGGATGVPFAAPIIQGAFTPPGLAKAHADGNPH